jgi:hypothetical protein
MACVNNATRTTPSAADLDQAYRSKGGLIAPPFLEELRTSLPVSVVVGTHVKLRKAGSEWRGLSPFNKERTPSFFVNDRKRGWWDFSSGKSGDIFTFVMLMEGVPFPAAVRRCAEIVGVPMPNGRRVTADPMPNAAVAEAAHTAIVPRKAADAEEQARQYRTQQFAMEIFGTARSFKCDDGSPAARYCERRKVVVPDGASGRVLRFHPSCPWRNEARELVEAPALVGLFRDVLTNEPRAILRRGLTPDGRVLGKPLYLGPVAGCAIKLSANEDVCQGLHVGEGVETMLSAMMLGFTPAWALGGTGNLRNFPLLAGIDSLTIIVDSDLNNAGQAAASECYDRWISAKGEVWCVVPNEVGKDMNDVIAATVL